MKKQILKTTLTLFAAAAAMTLTAGAAETPTNELTSYKQLIQTKMTLRFHEDGTFKMLFFSDIHGGGDHLPELVITNIQTLVARENPDFVFFDGDNHWGHNITEESLRSCLKDMVGYIESRNIPWAHVYGNHDSEHKDSISRPEQQKVYESLSGAFPRPVMKTSAVWEIISSLFWSITATRSLSISGLWIPATISPAS